MLKGLLKTMKSYEMELASAVMKWWNEMPDQPKEQPEFVKIADDLTTYPGNYIHVTLVPGYIVRAFCTIAFWGGWIAFGYLLTHA
jgi:hypothetical protein